MQKQGTSPKQLCADQGSHVGVVPKADDIPLNRALLWIAQCHNDGMPLSCPDRRWSWLPAFKAPPEMDDGPALFAYLWHLAKKADDQELFAPVFSRRQEIFRIGRLLTDSQDQNRKAGSRARDNLLRSKELRNFLAAFKSDIERASDLEGRIYSAWLLLLQAIRENRIEMTGICADKQARVPIRVYPIPRATPSILAQKSDSHLRRLLGSLHQIRIGDSPVAAHDHALGADRHDASLPD